MILVDANVLLYAYNPSFSRHEPARRWLEGALSRSEPIGLAWTTILSFLRIGTNPRAFESPLSMAEATAIVSEWLAHPTVVAVVPSERHWTVLSALLVAVPVRAAAVMDAHLAALAIEHGAILCSSDRDFGRYPQLRLLNPLDS